MPRQSALSGCARCWTRYLAYSSKGAISTILARAQAPLGVAAAAIAARVTTAPVMASDETSVRVTGKA